MRADPILWPIVLVCLIFVPGHAQMAADPDVVASVGKGEIFKSDFDDDTLDGWYGGGTWKVKDGMLSQTTKEWGRHILFTHVHMVEGTISVRARVDHPSSHAGNVFGIVLRYPGLKSYSVLRFGAYGATILMQHPKDGRFASWVPELGRMYEIKAVLKEGKVTAYVDGKSLGTVVMTDAKGPGYVGLYTEGAATFDDFELRGDWRLDARRAGAEQGTPKLELEFAEWAPVAFDLEVPVSVNGAIYVCFRNTGDRSARLDAISVGGVTTNIGDLPTWIPYARMRPARVGPGEVGQVEIKVNGLPTSIGMKLLQNPAGPVMVPVTIQPKGGEAVTTDVDLAATRLPLQVNFMGFSDDLATVFVYLQNNRGIRNRQSEPATIAKVTLNGRNVMPMTRFGSMQIAADVVPAEISLDKPLVKGQCVRLVVETADGGRTGHVLRAFPSKFNILIATNQMARTDFLEDIHNHCATALFRPYDTEQGKSLGFDLLPMRSADFLNNAFWARQNPVVGMWIDEVDKPRGQPIGEKLIAPMLAAEEYLDIDGEYLPLHCFNVCRPKDCAVSGHLMAADAIMHSYGYHMCPATGAGFGRLGDLPNREYRMSRRPFWPYFRDGEIVVLRDRKTKQTKRDKRYQRVLTPKEARWVEFGTLIQGAKSFAHWGYWAYPKGGFYFINEDCLRIGLGGPAYDRVGPYTLEPAVAKMLKDVWDEIGRINAEVRTIGPLVARSDVSRLARVASVVPPKDARGEPAAEAVALVSGLDTVVVVVLNHNIETGEHRFSRMKALSNPNPPKYPPVRVSVDVRLPEWFEAKHVFSVDWERIQDIEPRPHAGSLRFLIPELAVSRIYVVTSSEDVRQGCLDRHAEMKKRLAKIATHKPVHDNSWRDVNRN